VINGSGDTILVFRFINQAVLFQTNFSERKILIANSAVDFRPFSYLGPAKHVLKKYTEHTVWITC
jgi:hypothetical protein